MHIQLSRVLLICTAIFTHSVLGHCFLHKIKNGIQEYIKILVIIKVILVHRRRTWKLRMYTKEKLTSQRQRR